MGKQNPKPETHPPSTGLHNGIKRWEPGEVTSRQFYEKLQVFTFFQLSLEDRVEMATASVRG